jgi:hypothetical protein
MLQSACCIVGRLWNLDSDENYVLSLSEMDYRPGAAHAQRTQQSCALAQRRKRAAHPDGIACAMAAVRRTTPHAAKCTTDSRATGDGRHGPIAE